MLEVGLQGGVEEVGQGVAAGGAATTAVHRPVGEDEEDKDGQGKDHDQEEEQGPLEEPVDAAREGLEHVEGRGPVCVCECVCVCEDVVQVHVCVAGVYVHALCIALLMLFIACCYNEPAVCDSPFILPVFSLQVLHLCCSEKREIGTELYHSNKHHVPLQSHLSAS